MSHFCLRELQIRTSAMRIPESTRHAWRFVGMGPTQSKLVYDRIFIETIRLQKIYLVCHSAYGTTAVLKGHRPQVGFKHGCYIKKTPRCLLHFWLLIQADVSLLTF